jgi:hypothetical protein
MTDAEQDLWNALDTFVMVRDEEMGYDVPQAKLKTAVREFVDRYFRDSAPGMPRYRADTGKHPADCKWHKDWHACDCGIFDGEQK